MIDYVNVAKIMMAGSTKSDEGTYCDKWIYENGVYTPSSEYDGFSSIFSGVCDNCHYSTSGIENILGHLNKMTSYELNCTGNYTVDIYVSDIVTTNNDIPYIGRILIGSTSISDDFTHSQWVYAVVYREHNLLWATHNPYGSYEGAVTNVTVQSEGGYYINGAGVYSLLEYTYNRDGETGSYGLGLRISPDTWTVKSPLSVPTFIYESNTFMKNIYEAQGYTVSFNL